MMLEHSARHVVYRWRTSLVQLAPVHITADTSQYSLFLNQT